MKFNRIFLIVCDSMGIGNAKDAKKYNDFGANTVGHICSICDGLNIPTLQNLGFGNLGDFKGVAKTQNPQAYILKLNEDTTLEEKEAIIDETIIDIFLNKGDGYITVYSLNSAIDTDTIDDLYLNSGLYPEPSGDECINSSEIENIFINGGVVHEVFRC